MNRTFPLPHGRNVPATGCADRPQETSVAPFPIGTATGVPIRARPYIREDVLARLNGESEDYINRLRAGLREPEQLQPVDDNDDLWLVGIIAAIPFACLIVGLVVLS